MQLLCFLDRFPSVFCLSANIEVNFTLKKVAQPSTDCQIIICDQNGMRHETSKPKLTPGRTLNDEWRKGLTQPYSPNQGSKYTVYRTLAHTSENLLLGGESNVHL